MLSSSVGPSGLLRAQVAIRVDASVEIATGHVMRCLTLAGALAEAGAVCTFFSRTLTSDARARILAGGFRLQPLDDLPESRPFSSGQPHRHSVNEPSHTHHHPMHAHWLHVNPLQDAKDTTQAMEACHPKPFDWLVVDHYALDAQWERHVKPKVKHLMVIDDLADREHICDVLLDSGFTDEGLRYQHLVPATTVLLAGPKYALLRPEFRRLRTMLDASSRNPSSGREPWPPGFRRALVSFGGVDTDGLTLQTIGTLEQTRPELTLDVITSGANPHLDALRNHLESHHRDPHHGPAEHKLWVDTSEVAECMGRADIAIGGFGATSWERCCLGLPTVGFVIAENQRFIATFLQERGIARIVTSQAELGLVLENLENDPQSYRAMIDAAFEVVDGLGVNRVCDVLSSIMDPRLEEPSEWIMGN